MDFMEICCDLWEVGDTVSGLFIMAGLAISDVETQFIRIISVLAN